MIKGLFNSSARGVEWGQEHPATPLQALLIDPLKASGTQPTTTMTSLLGKNYAKADVLKTDTGRLQSGQNAAANLKSHQTATEVKTELGKVQASFKQEVAGVQQALTAAMDEASKEMNLDPRLARNTFFPAPQSGIEDALANKVTSGVSSAYDVISALPKLKPEQESKLVAKIMDMMTPKRDPLTDKVVEQPKIDTKYASAIEELGKKGEFTPEFLKEAFKPAEEQPEWEAMAALEEDLNREIAVHEEHEANNETLATIEKETGIRLDAQEKIDINPEQVIWAVTLTGEALNDPDFSGVKSPTPSSMSEIASLLDRNTKPPEPAFEVPPPKATQTLSAGLGGMAA